MPRATDELVRGIMEIDPSVPSTEPFINAASSLVDAKCTDISEANGTIVETWLALIL